MDKGTEIICIQDQQWPFSFTQVSKQCFLMESGISSLELLVRHIIDAVIKPQVKVVVTSGMATATHFYFHESWDKKILNPNTSHFFRDYPHPAAQSAAAKLLPVRELSTRKTTFVCQFECLNGMKCQCSDDVNGKRKGFLRRVMSLDCSQRGTR